MRSIALCALLLLCSCGEKRPPGPTAAQNTQLNEAEDMLNNMAAEENGQETTGKR